MIGSVHQGVRREVIAVYKIENLGVGGGNILILDGLKEGVVYLDIEYLSLEVALQE